MTIQAISQVKSRQRSLRVLNFVLRWPIIPVLVFQGLVTLILLNNTAFQDEALYLYAGRQIFNHIINGAPLSENYSIYFSGLPFLYPVLAGAADIVGGLELARSISLVSMLFVTWSVYYCGKQLFNRDSGLLAAVVYSVQGSVLFLTRFATYDALCLALLALGTVLSIRFASSKRLYLMFIPGPILILAILTKYAALLFVPIILLVMLWQIFQIWSWRPALTRLAIFMVGLLSIAGLAYTILPSSVLTGLNATTTNRSALMVTSGTTLALTAFGLGGALFALGLIGLIWLEKKQYLLAVVLLGAALLAPAYHIYKSESTSLHKHVAFGLFFVAPLAGYALSNLSGYKNRYRQAGKNWLLGLAICLVLFGVGVNQAKDLFNEWVNSDNLVNVLKTQVRNGSGNILAEESEVSRYYLQNIVQYWQWSGLYWFEYDNKSGNHLIGEPAFKAAISDGYFDLVILRYGPTAALDFAIDGGLKDGKTYELIAKVPYFTQFGTGDYWIWRKKSS